MSPIGWPAMLAIPLLSCLVLLRWPAKTPAWLWLSCLPALVCAAWPPADLAIPLWPGTHWGTDAMRRGFLGFTAAVWLAATFYAGRDKPATPYGRGFWLAWMLTLTGNLLLIISLDGMGFYVGYSVMSLSAYLLIIHAGGPAARKGGRIYLQLAIISELLIFSGLLLRFEETGLAMAFSQWQSVATTPLTALLILLGFGIKLGVWPLHFWMPFAYPAAPPVVCAVLSGAMMKTALLGLWLFLPVESPLQNGLDWLLVIAVTSAFYGVLAGLPQRDPRKVLAYSSISQAGYLMAIVVLAWQQPQHRAEWGVLLVMFAVHHGLAKSALFLGAGLAAEGRLRRWHWGLMAVPALALAGLPLTTGAVVKTLLGESLKVTVYKVWYPLLLAGSLATGLLVLRALWQMYRSQPDDYRAPRDSRMIAWLLPTLMAVLLPWLWPAMAAPLQHSLALDKLTSSTAIILIALALAVLAIKLGIKPPRVSRFRHPGMSASLSLKGLMDKPPRPGFNIAIDRDRWRRRERRWNHFWQQHSSVSLTALTLCVLLLVGWVWWF